MAARKMTIVDNPEDRRMLLGECEQILEEMTQLNGEFLYSPLYLLGVAELQQGLRLLATLPVTQLRDVETCPACGQPITRTDHYGLKSVFCEACVEPISQAMGKLIGAVEYGDVLDLSGVIVEGV